MAARDIVPRAKRSAMMRAVGQRATSAEQAMQLVLRGSGFRYRRNHPTLPGQPDFANRSAGWAIFVHGCFWHGHRYCAKTKGGAAGRVPVIHAAFWRTKIDANRARDARKARALRSMGLRVLTVWECELRDDAAVTDRVARFLDRAL